LYLLGYEAFFRGFLLFGMLEHQVPVWIAIAINTVFYSLAHIPKGKGEAFGAIPLGFLLCLAAISTGSFWVPFAVHVVMAWSNELFTLQHHRTIRSPLTQQKS
jgi:membrane protease YdiL (CAAX protease family)